MFIELVDALRCPADHDESWLVLGADRLDGREVVEGVLGCPVCRAKYVIANGVADLGAAGNASDADGAANRAGGGNATRDATDARADHASSAVQPDDLDAGVRLAALLDLTDGAGFAVLTGEWTRHAAAVRAAAETHLLLVNPSVAPPADPGISIVRTSGRLPLGAATARGVALDAGAAPRLVADAVRALRSGGRLVAPASLPLPDGVTELVRDDSVWVAERVALATAPIPLARRER